MAAEPQGIRATFSDAEDARATLESSPNSNSSSFQEKLASTIRLYEQCLVLADRISLFSPNESLEDIASADLQYLLLHYRLAELSLRLITETRKATLHRAQREYEQYLRLLDRYDMLSKPDAALLDQYQDSPTTFSTASTADPTARRETKIRRFKEEKSLKQKLDYLHRNPSVLQNDDSAYRELHLTNVAYCTHQAFASLESIAQELHILSLAPPSPPPDAAHNPPSDARDRTRTADAYSERLDTPSQLSAGMRGPLLDSKGKPLRPFTLLGGGAGKRQEFSQGVFRPDHSLPTMSIDQYLEEERRRGGMIEGGGEQSGLKAEVDEDDFDAADRETMKAREWDEFVEANPKGSGNTLNRG